MGRVLAIDPGAVRVGLALSDPTGTIAQPAATLPAQPAATLPERLLAFAREHGVEEMVVGLPRRLDGAEGPEARSARELAARLRAGGRRVTLVDERLSSVAAERALLASGENRARRRRLSDRVAAALILQQHLDAARHRAARSGGR